jgi:putative Mg2+ transporter-C (MgtC) family protein
VTTAATLFLTASVGIVAGTGHLLGAAILTALMILTLEIRHLPVVRLLDARRWEERARNDAAPPIRKEPGGTA